MSFHSLTSGIRAPVYSVFKTLGRKWHTNLKGISKQLQTLSEENYNYWKACMHIDVNSHDKDMCDTITQNKANGIVTSKSKALWNYDDKRNSSNLINCLNILGMPISNAIATKFFLR